MKAGATGFAVLLAIGLGGADADAQAVSLHGGARMYDGGGQVMVALRTEFPLHEAFLVEFAGSVADPREGVRSTSSVFEGQLQFFVPIGDVLTPYVGTGLGAARMHDTEGTDDGVETVMSLGAGFRVGLSEQLAVVLDARIRSSFNFEVDDTHTDATVGIRYLLKRPDRPRFRGAP